MNKVGIDTGHAGMNRIHCQIRTGPLWDQNTLIHPPPPPKHPPINFQVLFRELITGAFSDRVRRGNSDLNARGRQLSFSCYAHFAGNLFQTSFYDLGPGSWQSLYRVRANCFSSFHLIFLLLRSKWKSQVPLHWRRVIIIYNLPARSLAEYSL